jgi:hypothetical protein
VFSPCSPSDDIAAFAPDKHVRPSGDRALGAGPSPYDEERRQSPLRCWLVHGCAAAPAASGVNERAAVRSNTAHAPAHFTPALIDRCPSGPLSSLSPPSPFLLPLFFAPFELSSRTCSRAHTARTRGARCRALVTQSEEFRRKVLYYWCAISLIPDHLHSRGISKRRKIR